MTNDLYTFYALPINSASSWKHLIDVDCGEDLQTALARRHFDEPAFFTVYADRDTWITVGKYVSTPFLGPLGHSQLVSHTVPRNLIDRQTANAIFDDAVLLIKQHIDRRERHKEITERYSKNLTAPTHTAELYKFPSKNG